MLVRTRIFHGNEVEGVSIREFLSHCKQLVRKAGLLGGLKISITSAFQYLNGNREIYFSLFKIGDENSHVPVLLGAPREWQNTTDQIIATIKFFTSESAAHYDISSTVRRLQELISHSCNAPDSATVTIIIPAFNNFIEVALCLESIVSFSSRTNYEILIADDASPNFELSALGTLPGVTVIRNLTNLGYIKNVNYAAQKINTPFLLTLNQDTVVCPGWLDELVDEINRDSRTAIVGPRILDPKYSLLEAGGLVFRDAVALHRGRGTGANNPQFCYSREVDYVSGCAMLVRTEIWNRLGGLDTELCPAYYDDVDLSFRARSIGYLTRYAPLSCVIHFEGTSMGKDTSDLQSLKHFQNINQKKVALKHRAALELHSAVTDATDYNRDNRLRIVCVFDSFPNHLLDGGAVDFELIVQYLVRLGYRVGALFAHKPSKDITIQWQKIGILCDHLRSSSGRNLIYESELVFSFGTMTGIKLLNLDLGGKHHVHHTSDVATRRLQAMNSIHAELTNVSSEASRWFLGMPRDVKEMWKIEKPTLERPSTTLFVTEHDLQYAVENGATGNFVHFPILKGAPELNELPPVLNSLTVGFVGSYLHSPNSDAVDYFLSEMWPKILHFEPRTRFLIWGSNINERQRVKWSSSPAVEVRGWFATWDEVVAQTRVFVSPLRFGAGMKHKVLSTLINGRPIVGTSTSFEGFDTTQLSQKVMTNDPQLIIDSTLEMLRSDDACIKALKEGLTGMGTNFSRSQELKRVQNLIESVMASKPTPLK
jgi:GT2 family glycosyltransferase